MDSKDKYINSQKGSYMIENKNRGQIMYYSIDQVANLLNESTDNIKYYTNLFDDILKISIVGKEFRYTNNDVDKFEFLIKLKNRGMSLKEIQDYCDELPLDDTDIQHSENNLLSVEELIDSIKEEQQNQLNDFRVQLINDIQNINSLYIKNISSTIIEAQTENLNQFKEDLSNEIKDLLNSKFNNVSTTDITSYTNLISNIKEFISEEIDSKNEELKLNLQNDFNTFAQSSLTNNERLIKEVKDFKGVIQDAYYIQQEIETSNTGFLNKFLQLVKSK